MSRYSHLALLVMCLLALVFGLTFSAQPAQAAQQAAPAISAKISSSAANGCVPSKFTNKVLGNGLGSNSVTSVYVVGNTVYAGTGGQWPWGGLSISLDGGKHFINKSAANGVSDFVTDVYAEGSTVYAATHQGAWGLAGRGLAISTDGGTHFVRRTIGNGLGSNNVNGVFASGSTVYAATDAGLSISTNGGIAFANKTNANGLGSNDVSGVFAEGTTVYAATGGGLSISTDGGNTFINKTTTDGLGSNGVAKVFAAGGTVYAATGGGLSISTDGGNTFANKTTADGLSDNRIADVYAVGSTVYVANWGGLSISVDGGNTFTSKTVADGLGSGAVNAVYAVGGTVYVATGLTSACMECTDLGGLAISADGGGTFVNLTEPVDPGGIFVSGGMIYAPTWAGLLISNDEGSSFFDHLAGLPSYTIEDVYVDNGKVYAAASNPYGPFGRPGGLGISTDGGDHFVTRSYADGLASQDVLSVSAIGSSVYVGTYDGFFTSTDGGETFKPSGSGLEDVVRRVYAVGSTVYAATDSGVSISTDGGDHFINKTTADGLGSDKVSDVFAVGNRVYAATNSGLSISSDGGNHFVNRTAGNGLGSNAVHGVYAVGSTVYAATSSGFSISTDGANTFINKTTTDGLGDNYVTDVYVDGNTVYAGAGGVSIGVCDPALYPGAPTKIGPADGANDLSVLPKLSWTMSAGATSYQYCISRTKGECDGFWTDAGRKTSATADWLQNGTTYYWQVQAKNASGATDADNGAWWSFATDTLHNDDFDSATPIGLVPYTTALNTMGATTAGDDPTFKCAATKGVGSVWFRYTPANNGRLTVSTAGSNFDTLLAVWRGSRGSLTSLACNDNYGTLKTSLVNVNVIAGQTYLVEVAGRTMGGLKLAASLTPRRPDAPTLLLPLNTNKTTNPAPVLDWTDSPGAANYQVEVRKGSTTGTRVVWAKPTDSTYTPATPLQAERYYWRVGACNAVGCTYSPWWSFTVLVPTRPRLLAPSDKATVPDPAAPLDWSSSTDATRYSLQVRQDSTSGIYAVNQDVGDSSFTTAPLASGHWYYWRVRACSGAGCSRWTDWWKFKVP